MIHFDFTVTDFEAEVIKDILSQQLTRNHDRLAEAIIRGDNDTINFLRRDTEFLNTLFVKMHTTNVVE